MAKPTEENFNKLSTEDLLKKKKSITFVTGLLAGMLGVLLVMSIFLIIKKGLSNVSLAVVPFALSPILFLNYTTLSKINKELERRNKHDF